MHHRAVVMSVVLFAMIVAGMFFFTYLKKQELQNIPPPKEEPVASPDGQVAYAAVTRIDAKHFFKDGVHTFVGEIPFGTLCELLEVASTVAESFPEQISLNFSVINESEMCAQVLTNQRFKVEATGSEAATVSATFMGRAVELNLIPAQSGESPDDFELFIKG
jgi:hypothetical protein